MPNQRISTAQTETHSKILPSPAYIEITKNSIGLSLFKVPNVCQREDTSREPIDGHYRSNGSLSICSSLLLVASADMLQTSMTTDYWLFTTSTASDCSTIVYLRQRRYMSSPARPRLFVRLSVCKITQKHVHGFGWNFACRQMSGHGRTD